MESKKIYVKLSNNIIGYLDKIAKIYGISRSALIAIYVSNGLNNDIFNKKII